MPFFSFSLKKNFLSNDCFPYIPTNNIENNQTYFSKSTKLWKYLNKKENIHLINSLSFESRKPIFKIEIELKDEKKYYIDQQQINIYKKNEFVEKVAVTDLAKTVPYYLRDFF